MVLITIYAITSSAITATPTNPSPTIVIRVDSPRIVPEKWGVVKGKKRHLGKLLPFKKMPNSQPSSLATRAVNRTPHTAGESPEFQEQMDRYLELADSALQPGHLEASPKSPRPIHFKAN